MGIPLHVLLIEDSENDALLLLHELRRDGYTPISRRVETEADLRDALTSRSWDIVLCDYVLPRFSGLAALALIRRLCPEIPVIMVSGKTGEAMAVEAMRAGAQDYILKSNLSRLVPAVARELQDAEDRQAHRQTQDALRDSEFRLAQAQKLAHLGHFELSLTSGTAEWSREMFRIMGLDPALPAPGLDAYLRLVHPDDRSFVRRSLDECRRGDAFDVTYRIVRPDGAVRYVQTIGEPVTDVAGDITSIFGTQLDITDRKRASELLEQERAFLVSAIELLPIPIIFYSPSGEVQRANQASYRFLAGIDPTRWSSLKIYTADTRTPLPQEEWPITLAMSGEVVSAKEVLLVQADGRMVPVLAYATPIYVGGRLAAVLEAFQDITALKEADEAKNQFLAILSHELRTPLTNILGWAREAQELPELRPQALRIIRKNAEMQHRMLENLLELSRLIHGKLDLHREKTDLWQLTEQVVAGMRESLEERGIALHLTPPPEPLRVVADRKRIQDVIDNLLHNALKFSATGSRITLCGLREGNHCLLTVHDQGRGIAPHQLATLFDLFHIPTDADTSRGMRLGLALSRRIVEMHGGRIHVASPGPGKGSTFAVRLPLAEK